MHHGHLKGIIHRDIKPANILVGIDGEPKVIDFGVARCTNSDIAVTTQQTQVGQLIGTLQYMSPEQCDGDSANIDSRTDVYSLGAVLYELLAGRPALDQRSSTIYQATIMIKESMPLPLSTIDRRFRGDIQAIVAKAMEKDRDHRYQSVEALTRDIERHLAGEPIDARHRSAWVGMTRWMGRHPAITTSTATAMVVIAITMATLYLTLNYAANQPDRFLLSDEGDIAHLVTPFGNILATLGGRGTQGNSVLAMLAERPSAFGSGRMALFVVPHGQHSTSNQLWVSPASDLDSPIWQTSPSVPKTLPPLPAAWGVSMEDRPFGVSRFQLADVFPESPGDEIIVVQEQDGTSPNAIRIFDLKGTLLFETWHLGHIMSVFWWDEAHLLICSGDRHGRKDIEEHGYPDPPPYPRVVFAIRPIMGMHTGWINELAWQPEWQGTRTQETKQVVVWYETLTPLAYAKDFGPRRLSTPVTTLSGTPELRVGFDSGPSGSFDLLLGTAGEVQNFQCSDEFRQARDANRLPFHDPTLDDWPPSPEGK